MAYELLSLNERWWDWKVEFWDGWSLRLIADNDLTYHHAVEVTFEGVQYVSFAAEFSHPVFRSPSDDEVAVVRAALGGDMADVMVFAWTTDAGPPGDAGLIAARSVTVVEGTVAHDG